MLQPLNREQIVQLRNLIHKHFLLVEFRDDLCFGLDIRYDDLPGETLKSRVTSLVELCERNGRINALLNKCVELKPHINWLGLNKTFPQETKSSVTHPQKDAGFTGQLRRFSIWILGGSLLAVTIAILCLGLVSLLSQLVTGTSTPSQTRPVSVNTTLTPGSLQPTRPVPTFTGAVIETPIVTPSRTATPTLAPVSTIELNELPLDPQLRSTWIRSADGMVMVYVPEGTFMMGSDPNREGNVPANELPQHEVTLNSFWIDRTEVTNRMYESCVAAGACYESSLANDSNYNGDNYPVIGVSWYDADTYCKWVGGQLPTEAQWEYAARGDDDRLYPWGNTFDGTHANFCDVNCTYNSRNPSVDDGYVLTAPTGSYSPDGDSWVGATDMAGNVWEWVADWGGNYTAAATTDPTGPESGAHKVLRGGSWFDSPLYLRTAYRNFDSRDSRYGTFGFRCVVLSGH